MLKNILINTQKNKKYLENKKYNTKKNKKYLEK